MKKQWNAYVREKMQQNKITQEDIAEKLNKTQGAIGHWLTGRRTPNINEVAELIKIVGGDKVILNNDGTVEDFDNNAIPLNIKRTYNYPILSSIQAGAFSETFDYANSMCYEYLESAIETEGEGFFLEIKGSSMEPKFNEGDMILIDTGLKPHPGDYVAAVNGDGEATFKQYKELGEYAECGNPHFELVPLNPLFPTLSTKRQHIRIIGVAVQRVEFL